MARQRNDRASITHIGKQCEALKSDGEVCGSTWRYDKNNKCVMCHRAKAVKHAEKQRRDRLVQPLKSVNAKELEAKFDFHQDNLTPVY